MEAVATGAAVVVAAAGAETESRSGKPWRIATAAQRQTKPISYQINSCHRFQIKTWQRISFKVAQATNAEGWAP